MNNNLTKYIISTLAYYDGMDYPMTSFEIWKYLTRITNDESRVMDKEEKFSLAEVMKALGDEKLQSMVEEFRGYYFLRDRKELVQQRIERNKISERKIVIARNVVKWLRLVPFVRCVAIAGRLAMKNAESKSDLDVLIILKKGKIFTGRLLVTLVVHLLGKRRYGKKISNRICLNHFITKKYSVSGRDLFAAHEYSFVLPIFGAKAFGKFQAKNEWIKKYKINFEFSARNMAMVSDNRPIRLIRKALERVLQFDFIEDSLGRWQRKRIANNPKTKQRGGIILCTEEELAFWPNFENQGPKFFDRFQAKMESLKK